jgi:hypothetical protein
LGGSQAKRLIVLAPSLPHFTRKSIEGSARYEDTAKDRGGGVLVGPDIDFVGSGWTFLEHFFLPNQSQAASSNLIVDYHAAFFAVSHFLHRRRHGLSRVTTSMPRRKASERDQPHRRRSRNGCLNCRRRKIRCDEESPSCGYCIARGLTCSRGGVVLKWEAEYADNGLAFGRQGVGPAAGK